MKIKNIRLPNFDYSSNAYYFLTIASHLRQPLFLEHKASIETALNALQTYNAFLDFYVIMPDHIHLIIALEDSKLSLGEIIRRLKARASKEAGIKLWQPNYYEHVIRNEKTLDKIREYIQNNPEAMELKIESFYKKD